MASQRSEGRSRGSSRGVQRERPPARGHIQGPVPAREQQSWRTPRLGNWLHEQDSLLLDILTEIQLKSGKTGGTFVHEEWNDAERMFRQRSGCWTIVAKNLQSRYKGLKSKYGLYKELRNKSGWGWNEAKHELRYPSEAHWDELIKRKKDYKNIRGKPFPLYDVVHALCQKSHAEGSNMFTSADTTFREGSGSSSDEPYIPSTQEEGVETPFASDQIGEGTAHGGLESDDFLFANEAEGEGDEDVRVEDDEDEEADPRGQFFQPNQSVGGPSSGGSSSGSKRRQSVGEASTSNTRRRILRAATRADDDLVNLQRERNKMTQSLLDFRMTKEEEFNRCMDKIDATPGLTPELRVAGGIACKEYDNRLLVRRFEGDDLLRFLKGELRKQNPEVPPQPQFPFFAPPPFPMYRAPYYHPDVPPHPQPDPSHSAPNPFQFFNVIPSQPDASGSGYGRGHPQQFGGDPHGSSGFQRGWDDRFGSPP